MSDFKPTFAPFAWEPRRVIIYALAAAFGVTAAYAGVSAYQDDVRSAENTLAGSIHEAHDRADLLALKAETGRAYVEEANRYAAQNTDSVDKRTVTALYDAIDAAAFRIDFADKAAAATDIAADNAAGITGNPAGIRDAAKNLDKLISDDPKVTGAIDAVKTAVQAVNLANMAGVSAHR
ncbi:hypothetical protein [Leifsonia sp. Leaf264]|uniref:hypothetical protein n=1 Tax=Leifsonia sp. Leaf264 TaxID=1736314 RepID=UPI0012F733BA|nr:hypothetical protein [Leifsonia sp. Leaf264]